MPVPIRFDRKEKGMGTSISSIAEHAEEALRAAGYMESTVGQYRKIFRYCPTVDSM